jgi:hypothetical protein
MKMKPNPTAIHIFLYLILISSCLPRVGAAQIPGSVDIIQEFPDFAKEENDERQDSIDFEHSRVVAFSFHGGYDLIQGGLSSSMTNGASIDVALNYFMYAQSAFVLRVGTAFADLDVAGLETYPGLDGLLHENEPLRYIGGVTMYRFTMGYRHYFGHPAYPSLFSFLGLNAELGAGIMLRFERYTILENGPEHPGLLNFSDMSPIIMVSVGVEFPFLIEDIYLGVRGGYQLSLLSDEGDLGFVGENRDADWLNFTAYVMVHLE